MVLKKALFFRGSKEKDTFNFIYAAFIPDASIGVFRRKYITGAEAGSIMEAETAYTQSFLNILFFILKASFFPK